MAFTKAIDVAAHVKRHVLPGVVVSVGQAQGDPGIEVIVRGFSHPEDGMSRVWHIELIGRSGMMLDLVIMGLRKAGFEMAGEAPLMKGRLTQVLNRAEVAQLRAAARESDRKKSEALVKAEVQAAASVAQATSQEIEHLKAEIDRLKEMLEDMALMPTPRGPRGPQGAPGAPGADGRDGSALDLKEAVLADLGDVSEAQPEERMVLTWSGGQWKPLYVPRMSSPVFGGGGGGGGEGTQGPPGPQGPQGPQGEPGLSAYQLAVNAGYNGTEEEWLDSLRGEDGLTAYEIAVEEGFEGTQEEWVDSLKGEQGEPGSFTHWVEDENGHLVPVDPCTRNIGDESNPVGSIYVCEGGIFFNGNQLGVSTEGDLIYNGAPVGGSITVQHRNRDDMSAAPTNVISNITTLSFDTDSGFEVEDLGNGTFEAFVKMNSTFNPWLVQGQTTLDATGEEPVEFVAGPGLRISTDAASDPKKIIFETTGTADGGIPEAPCDGNFYVRHDCRWIELKCALEHLMIGDGGQFSPQGDGGNFTTGYYGSAYAGEYDGGNLIDGSTDAVDNTHLDGQEFFSPYGEGGDFTHNDANGDTTSNIEPDHATDYDGGNFSSGTPSDTCDELDGGNFSI